MPMDKQTIHCKSSNPKNYNYYSRSQYSTKHRQYNGGIEFGVTSLEKPKTFNAILQIHVGLL